MAELEWKENSYKIRKDSSQLLHEHRKTQEKEEKTRNIKMLGINITQDGPNLTRGRKDLETRRQ